MMRYGTSFDAVPQPGKPWEYVIYSTVTVWDDDECAASFRVGQRRVSGLPEIHTTTDVNEWSIDWADQFYKFACEVYAEVKSRYDEEINARPSDTSVSS